MLLFIFVIVYDLLQGLFNTVVVMKRLWLC